MVRGAGLSFSAAVYLVSADGSTLAAQSVAGSANGRELSAEFDLNGITPGSRTLAVRNPDGSSAASTVPFSIVPGSEIQLRVDITGRQYVRLGRSATYSITVANDGNVNSELAFLDLSSSSGFTLSSLRYQDILVWDINNDAGKLPVFALPLIPPGQAMTFEAVILPTEQSFAPTVATLEPTTASLFVSLIVVPEIQKFVRSLLKHKWDEYVFEPIFQDYHIDWGTAFKNAFLDWAGIKSQGEFALERWFKSRMESMIEDLRQNAAKAAAKAALEKLWAALKAYKWADAVLGEHQGQSLYQPSQRP